MLMWKKDDQLVALNDQVLSSNDRMTVQMVEDGNMLKVILAERDDGGNYSCEVTALQSVQQLHHLVVRG